jgi:hypothetical protein
MTSNNSEEDVKTTPGWMPEPRKVLNGRLASFSRALRRAAKANRKASSITSLKEQFRSRETSLARWRRASRIEIVVLMHQSILHSHHDATLQ